MKIFWIYKKKGYYKKPFSNFLLPAQVAPSYSIYHYRWIRCRWIKTVLVNIKNISDVTDKDFVKKLMFDKLVTKVNVKEGTTSNATDLINKSQKYSDK